MDQLIAQFTPVITSIVVALVGLVLVRLEKFIREKVKNDRAETTFIAINDMVRTVVADIGATVVAEMKEKAQDGKLTMVEAVDVKNQAVEKLRFLIPKEASKVIEQIVGDLDVYVSSKIEEEVEAFKPFSASGGDV